MTVTDLTHPLRAISDAADNVEKIAAAIEHLRKARELLKQAGAKRATERVRLALTSAGGALRHAELAPFRDQRREERRA